MAHLLALAPLDVWLRMLHRADPVAPRCWPRLGFILFTSFVGTVITAHERLLWFVWGVLPVGRARQRAHAPEVVVILGYYRSGTTHLQNLLGCDRRLRTPRWSQCLVGQGYRLAWFLVRLLLVPFLGRTRPQDRVGFGPAWPGEDDFALATWGGCSSIAGRHVFPANRDRWQQWHTLEGLGERDLSRWRTLTRRFVYKVTRGRADRPVVLKSPSHTARVAQLDRLFEGRVRFIHIVREPEPVIESNVRLFHALRNHALQPLPPVQSIRETIVEEYADTERRAFDELGAIDANRWSRVRFDDLRNDPMGTLAAVYDTMGLGFDDRAQRAVRAYMGSLGTYRNSQAPIELGSPTPREREVCAQLRARTGLDQSGRPPRATEYAPRRPASVWRGVLGAMGTSMICWGAWIVLVAALVQLGSESRHVALAWPIGACIGIGAHACSGRGTRSLGVLCALLTPVVVITALFPISVIIWDWDRENGFHYWWLNNWLNVKQALSGSSSRIVLILGMLSAYRHASERGPIVPGHNQ